MDSFLAELSRHSQESLTHTDSGDDETRIKYLLTTLAVARAALTRLTLVRGSDASEQNQNYPLQMVVAGPTQVGKSTMVNLLLQQNLAEASARAGHTVHCQGFHVVDEDTSQYAGDDHWASRYFGDLKLAKQNTLDHQVLGEYSLQEVINSTSKFQDCVIWDTPDFDSIRSFDYRAPLVKAIALADVLVFVVSKEKYADNTVWMMLELLSELAIPVVVVMNKTPSSVRAELKTSVEKKYSKALPDIELPEVIFVDEYNSESISTNSLAEMDAVQLAIKSKLQRTAAPVLKDNTLNFLRHHWEDWTDSVNVEHRLRREYEDLVKRICSDTLIRYRAEYIDSDRHREVMQLALSELLVLLEIPGMANSLGKIRSVVTWPVRTLLSSANKPSPVPEDDRNEERRLLDELGKHVTASLNASLSIREKGADKRWWSEIRTQVVAAQNDVTGKYDKALDNYQTLLQVEIDRAAQSLYQNLQKQPATLNGLRAARVTTDAAAVVLAVKSGGLGAVDLVVAPAMLSLTTLLTEGALGKYMDRVQQKLTEYQEKEVRSVIERKLQRPLLNVAQLHREQTISEERLQTMTRRLESGDV